MGRDSLDKIRHYVTFEIGQLLRATAEDSIYDNKTKREKYIKEYTDRVLTHIENNP
jgi:uncharacterized protein (UPF0218 family)